MCYSRAQGKVLGNGGDWDQSENTAERVPRRRDRLLRGSGYLPPFENGDPVCQTL